MFRIRTFQKENRNPEDVLKEEFDVNKALGIDNSTMPNIDLCHPNIVATFIDSNYLFVALFCNNYLKHYHFIYDI